MTKITQALYPYQREDVAFMLKNPRHINGNVMGLGKTIEALSMMEALGTEHNLIVCKHKFILEWFWQIDEWLDGDCLTPHTVGDRLVGLDLSSPRFVCINYELLSIKKYWEALKEVSWDCIIFDEAHKLKNHKAKRTKYAYYLARNVSHISLMTGTPQQNSPMDLFPLFYIINRVKFGDHDAWRDYFCQIDEEEIWVKPPSGGKPRPLTIKHIKPGESNHTDNLNFLLHKYMIRHEKSEVMPFLPPKQYRTIPVSLGTESKQYDQMLNQYFAILDSGETIHAPKAVAQMLRLRQICLDPNLLSLEEPRSSTPSSKTEALLELLEDLPGKVVIFSYFERYVRILAQELHDHNIPYVTLTGRTAYTGQDQEFQNNSDIKACLGTIGAMGECYTLTEAETVVFTDLFWNPAVNEQCEDRVYGRVDKGLELRRGALIIDFLCQGTVEEYVREVVRRKEKMNEAVVTTRVVDKLLEGRTVHA